jgi:hypothetical protein
MFLGSGFASESSTRPPSLLPLKLKFAAWAQHYIHILISLDPGPWPEPSLRHYLGLGMWHEPNTCPLRFLTKLRLFSLDPKCQRTLCILSLESLGCVCVCVLTYCIQYKGLTQKAYTPLTPLNVQESRMAYHISTLLMHV